MSIDYDRFRGANDSFRKADYHKWHKLQAKQQILRSQLGFTTPTSSRPVACQRCVNYHGLAYGYTRETRTILICGFHPSGWQAEGACPDWRGED